MIASTKNGQDADDASFCWCGKQKDWMFQCAAEGNLPALKHEFESVGVLSSAAAASSSSSLSHVVLVSDRLSNLRDTRGSTLLHYAAGNGHVDTCRYLLEHTASPSKSSRRTVVTKKPCNYVNVHSTKNGRTALHWCCRYGHLEVCRVLLEWRAEVDSFAHGNVTPLQLAIWQCHLDVAQYLTTVGQTNKYYINDWGCSVYHWLGKSNIYNCPTNATPFATAAAAPATNTTVTESNTGNNNNDKNQDKVDPEQRLRAMCEWLDDNSNNNNNNNNNNSNNNSNDSNTVKNTVWEQPNKYGQTPLHKAGYSGNLPVIRYLLQVQGITDTRRDNQGNTAADCAERNSQWYTAQYLRRYGRPRSLQLAYATLFLPRQQQQQQHNSTKPHAAIRTGNASMDTNPTQPHKEYAIRMPTEPPTFAELRRAYKQLIRIYHPDRAVSSVSLVSKNRDHNGTKYATCSQHGRSWYSIQEAYKLWTLYWTTMTMTTIATTSSKRECTAATTITTTTTEYDTMIRNLERHDYLKRELPLLVLYNTAWHIRRNNEQQQQAAHNIEIENDKITSDAANDNSRNNNYKDDIHTSTRGVLKTKKKNKRQKVIVDDCNHVNDTAITTTDLDAIVPVREEEEKQKDLDDFERRLCRLLLTLPNQQIPLSQLPKEYEKTYNNNHNDGGSRTSTDNNFKNNKRITMIRPKDYRCRKLGYFLGKYCSRTVDVIKKKETASPSLMETSIEEKTYNEKNDDAIADIRSQHSKTQHNSRDGENSNSTSMMVVSSSPPPSRFSYWITLKK